MLLRAAKPLVTLITQGLAGGWDQVDQVKVNTKIDVMDIPYDGMLECI
jgi:hypothetical protein